MISEATLHIPTASCLRQHIVFVTPMLQRGPTALETGPLLHTLDDSFRSTCWVSRLPFSLSFSSALYLLTCRPQ